MDETEQIKVNILKQINEVLDDIHEQTGLQITSIEIDKETNRAWCFGYKD